MFQLFVALFFTVAPGAVISVVITLPGKLFGGAKSKAKLAYSVKKPVPQPERHSAALQGTFLQ
jgi:hypothetical protein